MFTIWIDPPAYREIAKLPGHMWQRIRQAIAALANNPQPYYAKQLTI